MRSYGQYCALARALDVVGERWTLLIVRELFAHDARYSDLRDGLPGIASNLLAERLRHLQAAGVVEAYDAPPPVRASVYRLTERGRELGPAVKALVAWGAPLSERSAENDEFRSHWLALGLPTLFDGVRTDDLAPLSVLVLTGDRPALLQVTTARVDMTTEGTTSTTPADVVLEGDPDSVWRLLTGGEDWGSTDVTAHGSQRSIRRLQKLVSRRPTTSRVPAQPKAADPAYRRR